MNSMDSGKVAYKELFLYSMSITGEDCDEKTIGLEVMEVIWNDGLPMGDKSAEILVIYVI